MTDKLLLVGSIPFDTAEEVFRAFGRAIGEWLPYMPDGEIGERRYWIDGIAYRVFNGHPQLQTVQRPGPDAYGPDTWRPQGDHDQFKFKVLPGVDAVSFGDPGWRLGYAREAINSYFVFRQMKKDNVIPAHVRFQVCMPLTYSAMGLFIPDPDDQARVATGLTQAFKSELENIAAHIPAEELAIQWDLAVENRRVETKVEAGDLDAARNEAAFVAEPISEACSGLSPDVHVGLHSCYGTINGWPGRQPANIMGTVLLLNALASVGGRPIDFIHFPTIASADEAFFRPLEELDVGDARIYVGAIHHMHGTDGLKAQLETVKKFLPDFGLAAPCGFGRVPERPGRQLTDQGDDVPPDYIDIILNDHLNAVQTLNDLTG